MLVLFCCHRMRRQKTGFWLSRWPDHVSGILALQPVPHLTPNSPVIPLADRPWSLCLYKLSLLDVAYKESQITQTQLTFFDFVPYASHTFLSNNNVNFFPLKFSKHICVVFISTFALPRMTLTGSPHPNLDSTCREALSAQAGSTPARGGQGLPSLHSLHRLLPCFVYDLVTSSSPLSPGEFV